MAAVRYLTLVWPGLPWLWLRGSVSGLVLALAFALTLDVAVIATWIWPGLIELPVTMGLWTATAVIWLVATVSAAAAFPPPIAEAEGSEADLLFVRARAAYLGRDWTQAETRLRELLSISPTDGEAQLLLATLLRRVGRPAEARRALEALARSDSGTPWRSAIAAEMTKLEAAGRGDDRDDPVVLPLRGAPGGTRERPAAA
jgi:hypothetical protein